MRLPASEKLEIIDLVEQSRGQWFHFCKCFVGNGGAETLGISLWN